MCFRSHMTTLSTRHTKKQNYCCWVLSVECKLPNKSVIKSQNQFRLQIEEIHLSLRNSRIRYESKNTLAIFFECGTMGIWPWRLACDWHSGMAGMVPLAVNNYFGKLNSFEALAKIKTKFLGDQRFITCAVFSKGNFKHKLDIITICVAVILTATQQTSKRQKWKMEQQHAIYRTQQVGWSNTEQWRCWEFLNLFK